MARKTPHCVKESQMPGWEKLVQLHNGDEVAAWVEFEENGLVIPERASIEVTEATDLIDNPFSAENEITTDPVLIQKQNIAAKTEALLKAKLKRLDFLAEKYKGFKEAQNEVKSILDDLDKNDVDATLADFIVAADSMTNTAVKWLDQFESNEKEPTLDKLKRMEEFVSSFSLLEELSEDMLENEEHKEIFRERVKGILDKQKKVNTGYLKLARIHIAANLKGNFHKITRMYEKQAEQDFNKYKKPHLDKAEIPQAKAEFISNYMITHAHEIDARTERYIQSMLLQTTDIDVLSAWVVNPKDMNHDIVGIALDSLDEADLRIWNEMEVIVDKVEELNANFISYMGKKGDPEKQYEIFFVPGEHRMLSPDLIELDEAEKTAWENFESTYKNVPEVWNLYEYLVELNSAKDGMVFKGQRLGNKLPLVEKSTLERLYSKGPLNMIREGFLDKIKLRGKDVELGLISDDMLANDALDEAHDVQKVAITEGGEERANIPLYFRNSTLKESKDLSKDIVGMIVTDYHNSLRFKTKTETAAFLEVLKDVVHSADITQTTNFVRKLKVNSATGKLYTKKHSSQLEATLEALIRHRLYGIKIEGDPQAAKILQTLGHYTSILTMGANVLSGTANLVHGTTISWIEAIGAKGGYFTPKDRAKAVKQYDSNVVGMMADVGERSPNNKINLISRKFNAFAESHIANGKSFAQNNKIKRVGDTSALLMFNNIGEHAMQNIVMLSILNNTKVQDVNGNYLDKDYNPTKDRNKAIGVFDAMEQDGKKLTFHPSVHKTERTGGIGEKDMLKLSKIIRRVNRDLYGNYDTENKARIQRTGAGALMSQMRGWLVPGFQKRFRGLGKSGLLSKKDFVNLGDEYDIDVTTPEGIARLQKLSYNHELEDFEEGQYVTTLRFLRSLKQEVKSFRVIAGSKVLWSKLDDVQKGNIRKTTIEAAVAIAALMLSKAFEDDPDDPNDLENIYMAYLSRRLFSELATFANPRETIRTFRSPAIALSTVENAIESLIQMYDPMGEYETGRHAGENKLLRKLFKLMPVIKQYDRNVEDAYLFLTR